MIDQDVIDCLDKALSSLPRRRLRVDTAAMMAGNLKALAVHFERRAKILVDRITRKIPSHKRRPTYTFFCEGPIYGAFALHDRYDYIVLHLGITPTLTDFCQRMMAIPGLWPDQHIECEREILSRGKHRGKQTPQPQSEIP
jgi:hypothetical protein